MKYTRRKYLYWMKRAEEQGSHVYLAQNALRLFESGDAEQSRMALHTVIDALKEERKKEMEHEFYCGISELP
jgi:hypothetical protein